MQWASSLASRTVFASFIVMKRGWVRVAINANICSLVGLSNRSTRLESKAHLGLVGSRLAPLKCVLLVTTCSSIVVHHSRSVREMEVLRWLPILVCHFGISHFGDHDERHDHSRCAPCDPRKRDPGSGKRERNILGCEAGHCEAGAK